LKRGETGDIINLKNWGGGRDGQTVSHGCGQEPVTPLSLAVS
jgi:hypothetical protein